MLLQTQPMDNVFIDTSVFEKNNFLEGKEIKQLFKLSSNGDIKIILPKLIVEEIENRIKKNLNSSFGSFKKFTKEARILRNVDELSARFNKLNIEKIADDLIEKFQRELKKAKVERIDYPSKGIDGLFDKYFKGVCPFNTSNKKHEFPDAFALLSIEEWCLSNETKCHVLSVDNDLIKYKNPNLIIYEKYESYLDVKLKQIELRENQNRRITLANELFLGCKSDFEIEIKSWVEEQLSEESLYFSKLDYMEIHNIDIKRISVDLESYRFVSVEPSQLSLEAEANIYFEVSVEIDDESYAYHDNDDKEWHFPVRITIPIKGNDVILVSIIADIPVAGDEFMDMNIEEINDGNNLEVQIT